MFYRILNYFKNYISAISLFFLYFFRIKEKTLIYSPTHSFSKNDCQLSPTHSFLENNYELNQLKNIYSFLNRYDNITDLVNYHRELHNRKEITILFDNYYERNIDSHFEEIIDSVLVVLLKNKEITDQIKNLIIKEREDFSCIVSFSNIKNYYHLFHFKYLENNRFEKYISKIMIKYNNND